MKKIPLDATDIRILCAVQRYGNLSKSKLAEMVNLSATPSWIRLNRLKKAGIIRNYYANIAYDDVVDTTKVIVTLSLSNHRKSNFEKFETHIANIDEIIECMATGGGTDYVMKVITPSLTNFQEIMDQLLSAELGIDRYMTYIVTREIKSSQPNLTKLIPTK
ncbi:MAG: Lrp/AsnC family transcriptional regulator [Amylibacter sp.]|jgi:Lrp/AsnC family transcriptional regulator of ectoine degradation|tara:strand:- start:44221 stop:44706 length:486 start_codon:yes stop_codon:yes gene_type:complete